MPINRTVFMLIGFLALCARLPAGDAPPPGDVSKEIEGLKKDNQDLRDRVKALEEAQKKPAEAPSAVPAPTTPATTPVGAPAAPAMPGKISMGSDFFLKLRADVRLRNEWFDNAFDLENNQNDNWNSIRLRTRLGFDVDWKDTVGAYVQLMNEYRWGSDTKYNATSNFQAEDIRVDNAYIRIKHPWDTPFILTAGRQDLLAEPEKGWGGWYGEGWLLFDGTPKDGSASISFDSVKLRYDGIEKTNIDLIYAKLSEINQSVNTTSNPTANTLANLYADQSWDEDLVGLYAFSKAAKGYQFDLYALNKIKNVSVNYGSAASPFYDPKMYTAALGTRIASTEALFQKHFDFGFEGAYETGYVDAEENFIGATSYPDTDGENVRRDAYGAYLWGKANFEQEAPDINPWLLGRFDVMSGDDPQTKHRFEGWDSMYAEWPKYSELLIYQYYDPFKSVQGKANADLGAFTNMVFPTIELGMAPSIKPLNKKVSFKFNYRYMMAHQPDNGPGGGRKIGDLLQFYTEWRPLPFLRLHYYFDYFTPGSYYASDADNSWFSRIEIMFLIF